MHDTNIDFFTVVNFGAIADPKFKSIMKCFGLDIDEHNIVVSIFMVINLLWNFFK